MKPLRSLTGVRAVAAIWVLFFHSSFDQIPHMPALVARAVGVGYAAVSLFFVLSGFILTYNYASRLDARKGLGGYFVARAARIYPVYLLALAFGAIFEGPLLNPTNPPLPGLMANVLDLLGLQAWAAGFLKSWINFPGWSVSCELFFYAAFPAVLPLVRRVRPERAWALFLVVGALTTALAALGNLGMGNPQIEAVFKFHPLVRVPEFLTGVALGYAYVHGQLPAWLLRRPDAAILAALAAAGVLVAVSAKDSIFLHSGGLALPYALVIAALAESQGTVHRLLSASWAVVLGEASYSVYVLQIPVKKAMDDLWHVWRHEADKAAWFKALTFLSVIAVALVVNGLYEDPVRRRLLARFRPQAPQPLANEGV